jgi:hypothetical protein
MEIAKGEGNNTSKKLTYEQLEALANKLSNQAQSLYNELQRTRGSINRLDYLFRVIECPNNNLFSNDFLISCAEEIQKFMTPEEEDNNSDTAEESESK